MQNYIQQDKSFLVWMAPLLFLTHILMMIIVIVLMQVMSRVLQHVQMAHFIVQTKDIYLSSYHHHVSMMEFVVLYLIYLITD